MDHLWAPWRLSYVTAPRTPAGSDPCFLCRTLAEQNDRDNLVVLRTPLSVVVLNRFPYNNGHLLVCPRRHEGRLEELTGEELLDLQRLLQQMLRVLNDVLHPDAYNIGLNQGAAAGAGLPGHLHWHVVPRWQSDSNFMSVLSDTRVIVQSLETLYGLLQQRLQSHSEPEA
jgi:ATP adenylyltransferase